MGAKYPVLTLGQNSGWWIDGGYQGVHFNEDIARIHGDAVKRGSPKAIVTFNPGIGLRRYMRVEDYTAGELCG